MNAKAETPTSPLDVLKWLVALGLLAGGIYGFYYFENQVLAPLRVVGLLVVAGLAAVVAATTAKGRTAVDFMKTANVERQKVVWPTRQETTQTTLVVLVMLVIVAIIIWMLDWVFAKLVAVLVG